MPVEPRSRSLAEEDESEPCECEAPDQPSYSGVPGILAHVENGREVTDKESSRFALGCLQLHGKRGSIVGTDGHQLLVHSGFAFPWEDDILVPANLVFGRHDLPQDQPVLIDGTDKWVAFRVGPWTILLAINEGRFPNADDVMPRARRDTTPKGPLMKAGV